MTDNEFLEKRRQLQELVLELYYKVYANESDVDFVLIIYNNKSLSQDQRFATSSGCELCAAIQANMYSVYQVLTNGVKHECNEPDLEQIQTIAPGSNLLN